MGYRSPQSSPNLFINCYTEGNQRSEFHSPAMVIGGITSLAPFIGDGVVITGGTGALGASFPNGVAGANGHDPNNPVIGQLGSKINAGVALELWTRDQNAWYSLRYAPPGRAGWWEMVWSGSPDRAFPFRFSDALSNAGPGQFWMPNGYFVGGPQLLTATDTGPPTDRPNGEERSGNKATASSTYSRLREVSPVGFASSRARPTALWDNGAVSVA